MTHCASSASVVSARDAVLPHLCAGPISPSSAEKAAGSGTTAAVSISTSWPGSRSSVSGTALRPSSPRPATNSTVSGTSEPGLDRTDGAACGAPCRALRRWTRIFCNSGAEANEAALKIARKATGRTRIVALEGGFHGRTLGALSATGQPSKWEGFGPLVPGVSFARPNDIESLEAALAPASDTALVLLEPILGEGGVIPLEPEFAQAAAELALEIGALLCIDEVQAGMGRTGTFFAHEQLGIRPDLVTLAKGIANGLPMGALLAGERAAPGFVPGDHASTFGGNPVVAAAAVAVVEAIDDELLAHCAGTRRSARTRSRGVARGARGSRPRAARRRGARPSRWPACRCVSREGLLVLSAGADVCG